LVAAPVPAAVELMAVMTMAVPLVLKAATWVEAL